MRDEEVIESLLLQWQERIDRGENVRLEELCQHRPELLAALQQQVEVLAKFRPSTPATASSPSVAAPNPNDLATLPPPISPADNATLPPVEIGSVTWTQNRTASGSGLTISPEDAPPGFAIERELGRGGMGVVYLGRQHSLNRPVALKMVLASAHASPQELVRFLQEAESVAQLRHPNVVQVHEVGSHRGWPYMALEYCDGGSLDSKLAHGPLSPSEAAALIATLAKAVQAAHDAGIVHRDLKPQNVLLDSSGAPKVTDFGLAKRTGSGSDLTATGAILGTPSYMAPEQAEGKGKGVGPPADIYALGAILYECLAGRPPFRAATPLDTVLQVVSEEPAPPTRLNPAVPADLETIALKCLQKDPQKRYASARTLADDLERWLRGEPIQARPVGKFERAWKWTKRNKSIAALGLLIGLGVLTIAVVSPILYFWQRGLTRLAEGKEQEARTAQKVAEAARQDVARQEIKARRDFALRGVGLAYSDLLTGNTNRVQALLDRCPPEERGWEWRYVRRLNEAALATWEGMSARVSGLAYSPDGKSIASFEYDGKIRLRDSSTGKVQRTLIAFSKQVPINENQVELLRVAFTPDGRHVAAPAEGDSIVLWDTATGKEAGRHPLPGGIGLAVAVSPDGKWMAAGGKGNVVVVWSLETGREEFRLACRGWVRGLAFSPQGNRLAVAAGELRLWDFMEGRSQFLRGHGDPHSVAFSPDGRLLASAGGFDNQIRIWNTADGSPAGLLTGSNYFFVLHVAFSPDGRYLATAGWLGSVRLWEVETWREVATLTGRYNATVGSLAFSPNGLELVSGHWHGGLQIWPADGRAGVRRIAHQDTAQVVGLSASADGERVVTATEKMIYFWSPQQGYSPDHIGVRVPNATASSAIALRSDGDLLAFGLTNGTLIGWDCKAHKLAWRKDQADSIVRRARFSPDGKVLATAGDDGVVKIWDPASGQSVRELRGHSGAVRDIAFGGPGSLFSAGQDGTIREWDIDSGEGRVILGKLPPLVRMAVTPTTIAATDDRHQVALWDRSSNAQLWVAGGLEWSPRGLALSPDGRRVFVGAGNRVQVFDSATGAELLGLKGHANFITDLVMYREGNCLLTASEDGTFAIWDATDKSADERRAEYAATARSRHEQELIRAHRLGSYVAAEFHVDRLLPTARGRHIGGLHAARGLARAVRGDLEGALSDLTAAQKVDVFDPHRTIGSTKLLLQVALKRRAEYRPAFALATSPFGLAAIPLERRGVILGMAALVPDAVADPATLVRQMEQVRKSTQASYASEVFYGAALYRAGRFDDARKALIAAAKLHPSGGTLFDWLLMAMVDHKRGRTDAARASFDRAERWFEANTPQAVDIPGANDAPPELIWIGFRIVMDETAATLGAGN